MTAADDAGTGAPSEGDLIPSEGPPPVTVTVWTLWRGAEVEGAGTVELRGDKVRVQVADAAVDLLIPLSALDGLRVSRDHITLFPGNGNVIELAGGPELEEMGRRMRSRACTLPELTLALRGLGSARGHPGADHDRFFQPLLTARHAAQRASDPAGRLAAMRAPVLAAELQRVLSTFAAERFPASAPDRRALEAELDDLSAPVRASLGRLDEAARAATDARDDTSLVWWRAWAAECRALFAYADRCWLAAVEVLTANPIPEGRLWRWPWRRERGSDAARGISEDRRR